MPASNYIKIKIGGKEVEIYNPEEFPLSISYKLESMDDFQKKSSATSFDVLIPATVNNQKNTNDASNPDVEDLTTGEVFKNFQPAVIEANGHELLVGKAKYTEGQHTLQPINYKADFYGNNADWMIELKETTFWDVLKTKSFPFTKAAMIASWNYDGTDPSLFYVFAPVRYGNPMEDNDTNMIPQYMKPSLSKYWILYWAFQSIGYKINSQFFDTEFFRRQVMPWTWGAFLQSDGTRLSNLDFLARGTKYITYKDDDFAGFPDIFATNDSQSPGFDNSGVYAYNTSNFDMNWTYLTQFQYGTLEATFHVAIDVSYASASWNSECEIKVYFYKNGVEQSQQQPLLLDAPAVGRREFIGILDVYYTATVNPGDVITAKVYARTLTTALGNTQMTFALMAFELEYVRIPLGGTIQLEAYEELKKHKVLDLLRGVIDEFNLELDTDPINKQLIIEPTHDYALTHSQASKSGGFFNGNILKWNYKQDLSKPSTLKLYSDSERELIFRYKDDSNDGMLKIIQDRYQTIAAAGKYVFPNRFKAGKKEVTNRFFSPVMHYEVEQWKGLGDNPDNSPQMVCLIPENISNTSKSEAQNTFSPKSCYYKGRVSHVGWIFDGIVDSLYPYMFAVNYQTGGENDPILSYSDEKIGNVMGKGLLRRFYLQRLAIMRNGQYYTTSLRLKNIDVANRIHREHKVIQGQRYELVEIKGYQPLKHQSTECELRKHAPVLQVDNDSIYPTQGVILDTDPPQEFDTKYTQLKALSSDIKIPE